MNARWLVSVGVLMEAAYLSFFFVGESPAEVLLFIGVHMFVFLLLALTWWKSRPSNLQPRTSGIIMSFAFLFRLTLVFHSPVGSDDIYRYLWDGKVSAHGINPFALAPTDSALVSLHTAELPSKVNFPSMRTIYPPLAQGLFHVSHLLFGDSLVGLKLLLVLADLLTILILYKLFSVRPEALLVYAWSPLPVLYFGLDGHIDALGIPLLFVALYLLQQGKVMQGALSVGLSALAKLYPLFVAPFLFHLAKGWKKIVLVGIPVIVLLLGYLFYWEPTGGVFESLVIFNTTFAFNGSLFQLAYTFIGSNEKAHLVSIALFLIWWITVFALDRSLLEKVFLAFVGFIVCAPTVHPWYLTWLAALLAVRWSPAVFALLGVSVVSNWVVYEYRLNGLWETNALLLVLEYVPFYILLFREMLQGTFLLRQASVGLKK